MTTRTEEQRTVVVAERRIVGISSHRIGAGLLFRERDIIADAVFLGKTVLFLSHLLLKESQVLVRYGEMHVGLTVGSGVERTLHKMLLHRRARTFGIVVEEQHTLGQLSVVESLLAEHIGHHSLVVSCGHEGIYSLAFVLLANLVKFLIESEILDFAEESLFEIRGRHIVVGIEEGEHILEHTAGGTAGRHELHNFAALRLIVVPGLDISIALRLVGSDDTVAYAGCGFEAKERKTGLELLQLCLNLLRRNTLLGNLL